MSVHSNDSFIYCSIALIDILRPHTELRYWIHWCREMVRREKRCEVCATTRVET